ncbi:nucleoplasmin-like protein [Phlebotomus argentipes]|uniref:nucleoplasmin-like protein n=1 Tax=Phlebotomus argentipes TaxID=94469 RepID=UPI002892DD8A|nr:nucleoplasmin-like protein [Phlebotomus argentipes]
MSNEFFYGTTLKADEASQTWDPYHKNAENSEMLMPHKLIIKQVLLGYEAKEGEYNVVEVTSPTSQDDVKIPLAVLKVGETRSISMEMEFPDAPITFKLVQGSGPVHIHGHHLIREASDADLMGEMQEGEEDEDGIDDVKDEYAEEEEEVPNPAKRAKLANNSKDGGTNNKAAAKKK